MCKISGIVGRQDQKRAKTAPERAWQENVSMGERKRAYVYFFGRLGSNGSQSRPFALPPDQSIVQVWVGVFRADANSSPLFP